MNAIVSGVPRACLEVSRAIADFGLSQPLRGLVEIVQGFLQAAPDVISAAYQAAVEAVTSRLSFAARENVSQGISRILAGARVLIIPAATALAVFVFFHPALLTVGWVLFEAACFLV
jgi:hypothetical protein